MKFEIRIVVGDDGSNRTFMELKYIIAFTICQTCKRSNRTFMELK